MPTISPMPNIFFFAFGKFCVVIVVLLWINDMHNGGFFGQNNHMAIFIKASIGFRKHDSRNVGPKKQFTEKLFALWMINGENNS
jgi:hypothetical protein